MVASTMLEAGCIVLFIILSDKFNIIILFYKIKKGGENYDAAGNEPGK